MSRGMLRFSADDRTRCAVALTDLSLLPTMRCESVRFHAARRRPERPEICNFYALPLAWRVPIVDTV